MYIMCYNIGEKNFDNSRDEHADCVGRQISKIKKSKQCVRIIFICTWLYTTTGTHICNEKEQTRITVAVAIIACTSPQAQPQRTWQFVFKMADFHLDTGSQARMPLPKCNVDDMLMKLVPCYQDVIRQLVNICDPLLVNQLLHHRFYNDPLQ